MLKILKYSFFDMMRSRWIYLYFGFFFAFTLSLFLISTDLSKVVVSLMNVILILCPLIATVFGVMYYYNSREFTELLLAQPIARRVIFLGQYIGLALSLSLSLLAGVGIPFVIYGIFQSADIWNFFSLLLNGVFLSFIFSGISFWIALKNDQQKIRGFGLALAVWLFFAVIYDGIFLLLLLSFSDYPLERFALGASMFNPIDLSRITVLLQLDISALMGYTGAVFQQFLGNGTGMLFAFGVLTLWLLLPLWRIGRIAGVKDF
ncbi:MAG: ABC-2 transporter permease [Saprospiraceae bacterium]|nr:ABC-2 transporter permease [Saprospiraceae bacterium]